MKKIYIWGAGHYFKAVYEAINKKECIIAGIIDKDSKKQGKMGKCITIQSPEILKKVEFDYIIISIKKYQEVLETAI